MPVVRDAGDFLTVAEVAERCRVTQWAVRLWAREGAIPAYRIGGQWRVEAGEFEAWWRSRRNLPASRR